MARPKKSDKVKALKVTISGSYRTANRDIVDFDDVSGIIPFVDEDLAAMHVRGRYAVMWVKNAVDKAGAKLYPKRIEDMRQVFIDDIEEIEVDEFSYVGKDIKELTFEEMQDLATAKDLRSIPLPKELSGTSLREMREKAYLAYSEKVLGRYIDPNKPEYNYAKLDKLRIDGDVRREATGKITNEEMIEQEQKNPSTEPPKKNLTLDDLKNIAKHKGIQVQPDIGFDELYGKLYGGAA